MTQALSTTRTRPLTDPTTFGGRLYIARTQRGLSCQRLSDLTGLGILTIHGLEAGRVATTNHGIDRLAAALNVDRDWLVNGRVAA